MLSMFLTLSATHVIDALHGHAIDAADYATYLHRATVTTSRVGLTRYQAWLYLSVSPHHRYHPVETRVKKYGRIQPHSKQLKLC